MDVMRLRPKDVPELARRIGDGGVRENAGIQMARDEPDPTLWLVSAQMSQLVAPELMGDPDLLHPELHVDGAPGARGRGVMAFEGGLNFGPTRKNPQGVMIHAIHWFSYKGSWYMSTYSSSRRLFSEARNFWISPNVVASNADGNYIPNAMRSYGFRAGDNQRDIDEARTATALLAIVCTAILLSSTPTAATATTRTIPGAKIKGQRRRQAPAEVKVVELRQMKHQTVTHSPSGRQYHHRWVVRGHWRDQACGPGLKQRRRVWVPPYTKGPDGAPLLERPTVFAWRR